jgi:hypothetical protein
MRGFFFSSISDDCCRTKGVVLKEGERNSDARKEENRWEKYCNEKRKEKKNVAALEGKEWRMERGWGGPALEGDRKKQRDIGIEPHLCRQPKNNCHPYVPYLFGWFLVFITIRLSN